MDIHKIRYCNSSGFIIKNDRVKHDIINSLESQIGYNPLNLFEKSYSDRLKDTLKSKDIVATYISRGKYVYLYLTRIYNENVALIIEMDSNSKNVYPKIISIPCSFSESLYNGTLFYGEIYRSFDKKWYFLCEKLLLDSNYRASNNCLKNIESMNKIINNGYVFTAISPFIIQQKKFFNLNDIEDSLNELKKSKVPLKGIKFYGLKIAINFYFNTSYYTKNDYEFKKLPELYKLDIKKDKAILKKTMEDEMIQKESVIIDTGDYEPELFYLEMRKTNNYGIYELYARTDDSYKLKKVGKARIQMIEMSQNIINDNRKAFIVIARYNYIFKKFNILHIKKGPISHYDNVMKDIERTVNFPIPNYAE